MQYDLVIRNGTVVDGSGIARYRADVGVRHGRIATIGRIHAETIANHLPMRRDDGSIVARGVQEL